MDKLKKELSYLEQKVREEINKCRAKKTSFEEQRVLNESIMIRQARIVELKCILQGLTKKDLEEEAKIGSKYNNNYKSFESRTTKSSSAGWNFKKDYRS